VETSANNYAAAQSRIGGAALQSKSRMTGVATINEEKCYAEKTN
jgi:hypothetical protein